MNEEDLPGVLPNTMAFAADFRDRHFGNALGVQFDTYHCAKRGDDIAATVSAYAPIIEHIQVSDFPNRNEPGAGALDFPQFFQTLHGLEYAGFIGAEYQPRTSSVESFGWMKDC